MYGNLIQNKTVTSYTLKTKNYICLKILIILYDMVCLIKLLIGMYILK